MASANAAAGACGGARYRCHLERRVTVAEACMVEEVVTCGGSVGEDNNNDEAATDVLRERSRRGSKAPHPTSS